MHHRARPVDRRLIGADELGRERVFDTAVDMGDVYGGLPLPDQFRGVFHAADGPRGSVPAGMWWAVVSSADVGGRVGIAGLPS